MMVALAACSGTGPPSAPDTARSLRSETTGIAPASSTGLDESRFASKRWGFTIAVPPGWNVHRDFAHGYLQPGTWKAYAGPDSTGTPVVSLAMPGSNRVTEAEVRIGVSRLPQEVQQCPEPPPAVRAGSVQETTIHGVRFTRFDARDAAMSHYLDVHGYRTTHDGACYAIDLLVYGTNPEVYDPPATPPFTRAEAFARMQRIAESFRFTRR